MSMPIRPRSTRDRPAKPPLSENVILDTALAIVREEGLEAVTMRRLAAELDTGPASLYVYFAGRDELRTAMMGRVGASVRLEEPDPSRWREQVHALVDGVLAALESHPGIASVAVANPPTSTEAMAFAENLLGLMLAGGIAPRDAAWALDILPLLTTVTAIEADARRARGETDDDQSETAQRLRAAFESLPADRFPLVHRHAQELVSGDGDERFHFAIDVFLDGLVARTGHG